MIESDEQKRISEYYDHLVDQYGYDPRACDASTRESLRVRYRVLSDVMDLTNKSVLEVGCGFGDLGAYLKRKYKRVHYTGIDISSRMIEEGRKRYPKVPLYHLNVLDMNPHQQFDAVLAQGVFYLLKDNAESRMWRLIEKMFSLARQAVAFSTLSAWASRKNSSEFYADPIRVAEWCRRLTPFLVFRHDYHPGDFSVYLYKEGRFR